MKDAKGEILRIISMQDFISRNPETDIFISLVESKIQKLKTDKKFQQIVTMSTVPEENFLNFIGMHEDISISSTSENVEKKLIKCKSIHDILNPKLFDEMNKFFDSWLQKAEIGIGLVIVFVPNEKVGRFLHKNFF